MDSPRAVVGWVGTGRLHSEKALMPPSGWVAVVWPPRQAPLVQDREQPWRWGSTSLAGFRTRNWRISPDGLDQQLTLEP